MKQRLFEIQSNEQIAKNVYRMQLAGDTAGILPGQFVNIRVEGQFLRRPISVCNISEARGERLEAGVFHQKRTAKVLPVCSPFSAKRVICSPEGSCTGRDNAPVFHFLALPIIHFHIQPSVLPKLSW